MITHPDRLVLVEAWHVIVVPQPDGTWGIPAYIRNRADHHQLQQRLEG